MKKSTLINEYNLYIAEMECYMINHDDYCTTIALAKANAIKELLFGHYNLTAHQAAALERTIKI